MPAGRCQVPDHCRPSPNILALWRNMAAARIQTPVSDRTCGFDSLQGYRVRMNNALWGNRQPTGFWLREFRFEPWRGSRSADPKRTLPGGLTAGLLILDQVGGGSNPPWAASRIPLCGVNRPRGSGLRRWRSRSMFDAMAPFQDRRHNALIAQSGQSGCLVSSVRRRFESGLGLSCAFGCCRHSSVAERFLG